MHVSVNGVNMAYTVTGSRGPDVLLLHGWMCNRKFWSEQIQLLSEHCRVLAVDFRGHGDSDVPQSGYTIEQLADDVYKVMNVLGISQAAVVGHSMGGMVAQQFCISHMACVSDLVLVTTIAADIEDHLVSKRIEADALEVEFEKAFERHFESWFGSSTDPKVVRWVREQMLRTRGSVGLELVRSYRSFDLRARLVDFSMPTLVIGTSSDTSAMPVESKTLAELIPGAQLVMIAGAGHFPMLEVPEVFNKELVGFLSRRNRYI